MRDASFLVLLLSLLDSGKSPLQTALDINFCDEARCLGAVRTGVCFPLWAVCTGRERPSLKLARYPWSNQFDEGLADSRRSFFLLAGARRRWSSRRREIFTIIATFSKGVGIRCALATPGRKVCATWGQKFSTSLC